MTNQMTTNEPEKVKMICSCGTTHEFTIENNQIVSDTIGLVKETPNSNYVDSRTPEERANEPKGIMTSTSELEKCKHCKQPIAIRNPSGFCDHLYYPDNCEVCKTSETSNSQWEEEFDGLYLERPMGEIDHSDIAAIKSFIRSLLLSHDEALVKEIGGMNRFTTKIETMKEMRVADIEITGKSQVDIDAGWNSALSAVIEIIRKRNM